MNFISTPKNFATSISPVGNLAYFLSISFISFNLSSSIGVEFIHHHCSNCLLCYVHRDLCDYAYVLRQSQRAVSLPIWLPYLYQSEKEISGAHFPPKLLLWWIFLELSCHLVALPHSRLHFRFLPLKIPKWCSFIISLLYRLQSAFRKMFWLFFCF